MIILTPCPPRKKCQICEARMNVLPADKFSKADKYRHQAEQAGLKAAKYLRAGIRDVEAVELAIRAASFVHLAEEV